MKNGWIVRITRWLFAGIVIATAGVLIAVALMHPLTNEYTKNHQLSYVCLSSAGLIAFLVSLVGTKSQTIYGFLMLAIELYLFGLAFQLFTLIL